MPRRMTMPIRPKIELNATFTQPSRLVWHIAGYNLTADPTRGLGQPSEEKILCSSNRHALFGALPNQTARFTQGHGIHGQHTLVVHCRV